MRFTLLPIMVLMSCVTLPQAPPERVIDIARVYEGHEEVSHNSSPYIDYWLDRLNIPHGSNYCGAFVAFVLDSAKVSYPTVRSGVARHYQTSSSIEATRVHQGATAPKGSIVVWGRRGSWTGHVDISVESWSGREGRAIGANTSPEYDEGRGHGVYEKQRYINPHAYFRIIAFTPTK